jgi:ankyrin repeat protein
MLLAKGAAIDTVDIEGSTALHKAVTDGHAGVVKILLGAGASRDAKNGRGQTPAVLAAQRKNAAVIAAISG